MITEETKKSLLPSSELYLIICKRHLRRNDPAIWFWGPNGNGYTNDFQQVGLYTEEEIKFTRDHESDDCLISLEIITPLLRWAVYENRRLIQYVPNTKENKKILGILDLELLSKGDYFSSYESLPDFLRRNENLVKLVNEVQVFLAQPQIIYVEDPYPEWDVTTFYRKGTQVLRNGVPAITPQDGYNVEPILVKEYIRREELSKLN